MDENWVYTNYANAYAKVKSGLVLKDDVGFGYDNTNPEGAVAVAFGATDAKGGKELANKSELIARVKAKLS